MKAKKSLGQHFLKSQNTLKKIIEVSNISSGETVLEIGPGKGVLTQKLLDAGAKVVAVEKDVELINLLKEKFSSYDNFEILEGDILSFDERSLKKYKVIANIPYYITGAILEKFLTSDNQPEQIVLMVQKEVAERIAKNKKESILSLSVKVYGNPKYIETVSRKKFSPSPEVDSAILSIENISHNFFKNKKEEELFFKILKAGFSQKRKLLFNNLKSVLSREKIEKVFSVCSIDKKIRAEDVPKGVWNCIIKSLSA